jgi:hypothetical protein
MLETNQNKLGLLEKFGVYYLNFFYRIDSTHSAFDLTDAQLRKQVNKITFKGIFLASIVSIFCVFPTIWVDVYFTDAGFLQHYSWVGAVTVIAVAIEFYLLFVIALKAVHDLSELINMHGNRSELLDDGLFSVKNILARTALELPDPELKILGIDPFERISKRNLFILGLFYKGKIFLTNLILKTGLKYTFGNTIGGISILYEAMPVEIFWNAVVIKRVVHLARLRLFGFALANEIANTVVHEQLLLQLSDEGKIGCLRAVGNAVVMAQNYHPNMIILLIRFQQLLNINEERQYDDWELFLGTLDKVNKKERNFLLDVFTIAIAFDGKISHLETDNLRKAYGEDFTIYYPRLLMLTEYLKNGELNAALALCKLDFVAG